MVVGCDKSVLGRNQFPGEIIHSKFPRGAPSAPSPVSPSPLTFSHPQALAPHSTCQVGGCIPHPRGHINLL